VSVALNLEMLIFGFSPICPPKERGNRDEFHGFVHSKLFTFLKLKEYFPSFKIACLVEDFEVIKLQN
jgi:hypothetical protein